MQPSLTTQPSETESPSDLARRHSIRITPEAERFLAQYGFLRSLIDEAAGAAGCYFGGAAQLSLDLVTDPEGEGEPHLFLYVSTPLSTERAMEKLAEFDEGWWLGAMPRAQGRMTVEVDFAACSTGSTISS